MEQYNIELITLAARLSTLLEKKYYSLVTAESCTGGWLAHIITSVPTCSARFERGFITYSKKSKIHLLGVSPNTIEKWGVVSTQVAEEMAAGAQINSLADIGISVTGASGPDSPEPGTLVGACCFGWAVKNKPVISSYQRFSGDRITVNYQAVKFSLSQLISLLHEEETVGQ